MRKVDLLILITFFLSNTILAGNANDKNREKTDKNTYVLIVSGISKDPQDRVFREKAISGLQELLSKNPEINPQNFTVLTADNLPANSIHKTSTAENLQATINIIGTNSKAEDRFIFYYIGQANIAAEKLRLNLPGEDITHEQLARWIKSIKASSMLIVLDCPGSALAAKAMSGRDRIVICSCTDEQKYRTRFSEYFIPAFTDEENDTNNDGKISVLEAFTAASRQIDDWFRQNKLLTTETPVLEDNGDGRPSKEPWKYKTDRTDGLTASDFFL
ncbi:MAG: hypothetical protein JW715_06315 [Sedimentisphaerales bacterium]|nr:hypothetical protein [Sedimentisphaerales bacterium]